MGLFLKSFLVVKKELVETKNELAGTKNELAGTRNEQAETKNELAETKNKLAETKNKQAETKNELSETKNELAGTKNELAETKNELVETKNELNQQIKETAKGMEEITRVKNQLKTMENKLTGLEKESREEIRRHDELHTKTLEVVQKVSFDTSLINALETDNAPEEIFNLLKTGADIEWSNFKPIQHKGNNYFIHQVARDYNLTVKILLSKMNEGQIYYPSENEVIFKLLIKGNVNGFQISHAINLKGYGGKRQLENRNMVLIKITNDYQCFVCIDEFDRGNCTNYLHYLQEKGEDYLLKDTLMDRKIPWDKCRNDRNEVLFYLKK